jgi:hypothetical protein
MASFRVSSSSNSVFSKESVGDLLILPTSSISQSILLGTKPGDYPALTLGSNTATVNGVMTSASVNTNLVQACGIHLNLYDPTLSNMREVIAPMYVAGISGGSNIRTSNIQTSNLSTSSLTVSANASFMSNVTIDGFVGVATSNAAYPLHVKAQYSNVSIYADYDITAFSDARVKGDLQRIQGALDKVGQLSGYTYVRTDEGAGASRLCGVIAQEVAAVLPEAVHVHPHTGMLSVSYGNLAASLLIEAIKELRAENTALALRVSALEVR